MQDSGDTWILHELQVSFFCFYLSLIFMQDSSDTWVLHELQVFICKALKGEAIVTYASSLITQQMEACGSPDVLGRLVPS
jgi:hypothetical protein